jgi:hypothetical protein
MYLLLLQSIKNDKERAYQLDFVTPVISPREARDLKQILHTPNLRINARGLPQSGQRL